MGIEHWWPKLEPSTRRWLFAHNGEAIPAEILAEMRRAGAILPAVAGAIGGNGDSGFLLSDETIDWIEAVANEERPDTL